MSFLTNEHVAYASSSGPNNTPRRHLDAMQRAWDEGGGDAVLSLLNDKMDFGDEDRLRLLGAALLETLKYPEDVHDASLFLLRETDCPHVVMMVVIDLLIHNTLRLLVSPLVDETPDLHSPETARTLLRRPLKVIFENLGPENQEALRSSTWKSVWNRMPSVLIAIQWLQTRCWASLFEFSLMESAWNDVMKSLFEDRDKAIREALVEAVDERMNPMPRRLSTTNLFGIPRYVLPLQKNRPKWPEEPKKVVQPLPDSTFNLIMSCLTGKEFKDGKKDVVSEVDGDCMQL